MKGHNDNGRNKNSATWQGLPMHLWIEAARRTVYVKKMYSWLSTWKKYSLVGLFKRERRSHPSQNIGFPLYRHIPKDNRTKLNPSGRKGIFMGYSETSKAYWIYFPTFKNIDINKDVTFDEESPYSRSRKLRIEEVEEPKVIIIRDTTIEETNP